MVFASFLPRLPEIRDRIGVDLRALGLFLTLGSLGGLAGSALCGLAIERLGSRRVMIIGAVGLIVVLPTVGWASGPVLFLGAVMALHLFDVLTDVTMNLQGSRLSARRPVPVISRLHGLWSIGTVTGGIGASAVTGRLSLEIHLVAVSVILIGALTYVGPRLLATDEAPTGPTSDSGNYGPGPASVPQRWGRVGVLFGGLAVATIAVEMVPAEWASLRLADDLGASGTTAGLGFVAVTAGMVTGRFGGDTLTARLGPGRLGRLAAGTALIGLMVGGSSPLLVPALMGLGLAGLGASVLFPRLYDDAARAPGRPGAALAALTAGIRVGAFVVPVSVGTLAATNTLSVGAAMLVVAAPAALGLVIVGRPTVTGM
jgi:predicted MFS family arabinose efflux permease